MYKTLIIKNDFESKALTSQLPNKYDSNITSEFLDHFRSRSNENMIEQLITIFYFIKILNNKYSEDNSHHCRRGIQSCIYELISGFSRIRECDPDERGVCFEPTKEVDYLLSLIKDNEDIRKLVVNSDPFKNSVGAVIKHLRAVLVK